MQNHLARADDAFDTTADGDIFGKNIAVDLARSPTSSPTQRISPSIWLAISTSPSVVRLPTITASELIIVGRGAELLLLGVAGNVAGDIGAVDRVMMAQFVGNPFS